MPPYARRARVRSSAQWRTASAAGVDFGEDAINLRGELVTCTRFALRLSVSGKSVQRTQCLPLSYRVIGRDAILPREAYKEVRCSLETGVAAVGLAD
jgi:hypothetical protein